METTILTCGITFVVTTLIIGGALFNMLCENKQYIAKLLNNEKYQYDEIAKLREELKKRNAEHTCWKLLRAAFPDEFFSNPKVMAGIMKLCEENGIMNEAKTKIVIDLLSKTNYTTAIKTATDAVLHIEPNLCMKKPRADGFLLNEDRMKELAVAVEAQHLF